MRYKSWLMTIVAAGGLSLSAGTATAQTDPGTPGASTAAADGMEVAIALNDLNGEPVGEATFTEGDGGTVTISVTVEGLEPGDHGIHVHETGVCDPQGEMPFSSAGDHYNPTGAMHGGPPPANGTPVAGTPEATAAHAGDLGNIAVGEDGTGELEITTDRFTLSAGESSLADADGSALVIHENPDDLETDPSGDSGGRIACGVVFPSMDDATPAGGTPEAAAVQEPLEALDSLRWSQPEVTVSPGDTIPMINVGFLEHDFVVDELGIDVDLPTGELLEATIPEDAPPGTYRFYCSVPGHAAAGMIGILIVQEG